MPIVQIPVWLEPGSVILDTSYQCNGIKIRCIEKIIIFAVCIRNINNLNA